MANVVAKSVVGAQRIKCTSLIVFFESTKGAAKMFKKLLICLAFLVTVVAFRSGYETIAYVSAAIGISATI